MPKQLNINLSPTVWSALLALAATHGQDVESYVATELTRVTQFAKVDNPVQRLYGIVSLPDDFDYKKELANREL